ncbi:MAG: LysR family transcriptional regulator [Clostridiaceae bacterium]|nr:LysR family transcriptional regulator [Clostridiaceae bacterium]
MTLRHLTIFAAVIDAGGMNKAAKVLHLSQPSISQAVAELEQHYGVKLFERLSQRLYLTKDGELLLSFARHILDSYQQMEATMNQKTEKTQIEIGCSISVGTCLINGILDEAEKALPQCEFHVMVTNSSEIEQALLSNQIDIGLIEGSVSDENLTMIPMCKDELVLVCGTTHPFAKQGKITLQALDGQNYVSRESGSAERNQYEQLLEQQKIHLKRIFCSTNTEAIKNAVIHGRGIAIFSKRMIDKEVQEGSLKILPVENLHVIRNFHFVRHKNKYMSKALRVMQEICVMFDS